MSPSKIKGGEVSPLAPASSPQPVPERSRRAAAVSSATPLSGAVPRNAPMGEENDLSSEWPILPLAEISINLDGKRRPVKESERARGPYPYYGASGIVDHVNDYLFDGEYLLIGEDGENLRTRQTPIAFLATGKFWVNNHAHIIAGNYKATTRFLGYSLQNTDISGFLTGAVMPKLTQGNLNKIPIRCPPLPIQKAIAHILGTLDDRIELCRRMNETLEAMARALFKDWFIDFGPVRAKMEGREPPGLSPEIAALFPSKLVDSELGEIPEGWDCGKLSDIAKNQTRSIRPERMNSELAYIGLEHMPRKDVALSEWGSADGLESNKLEFNVGEILFGKLRPYFHKVGIAPINGVCSTDIIVMGPKKPSWFGFVLEIVSSDEFVEHTNAGSTGTKMPRTSWAEMSRFKLVLPGDALAQAFDQSSAPMVNTILSNIHRRRSLSTLRDTLLPKLLSGELSIPEAMLQVEAMR